MNSHSLDDRVSAIVFVALLWLPLVASLAIEDAARSETEQRKLAPLPRLEATTAGLAQLPRELEAYYDDRLGLRDDLIRAWSWLHIRLLGISPSDKLIVGQDGWLFFGDDNAVAQYRGVARFDEADLARWARVLEERRAWLKERGTHYLLVLVPNKHRIYGEYMPASLPRAHDGSQLDQLVDLLQAEARVPYLDLRPVLERASREGRVYHKTDTHWNDRGAHAAYVAILERLAEIDRSLAPRPPVRVRAIERTTPGLGLARIVGLSRAFPERSLDLVVVDPRGEAPVARRARIEDRMRRQLPVTLGTRDPELATALVFRDSFADALVPYLSESFERIAYLWDRDVDPRAVEAQPTDVVIQVITERFLDRPPRGVAELKRR